MKRIKKSVPVPVTEEVVAVEITADEFAEIAAHECAKALADAPVEDMHFAIMLSLAFADFSANLMHRLFDDPEEEDAEAKG
jgi:hypothetical protein